MNCNKHPDRKAVSNLWGSALCQECFDEVSKRWLEDLLSGPNARKAGPLAVGLNVENKQTWADKPGPGWKKVIKVYET